MSRGPLHLLPTERHVERALGRGELAMSWRSFLRKMTASQGARPATLETTQLATSIALDAMKGELGWDAGQSVVRVLDDALGALRRAGVGAPILLGADGARGRLLGRLLERTDELLLGARTFDERATGFEAAKQIARADGEDLPRRVIIEGLFDWDGATCAWVEALARRVPVTVRIPRFLAGHTELTRAPDTLLSWLEERWQPLSDAPELELLEMTFPAQIELLEAANEGAEARAIVRAARDALTRGVSAEAIAVVLPSLDEPFLEPLRAAFAEANVPFSEPRGRPASAAPAVRAALSWLDLAAAPLERNALVDLLRSSAVDPAPFIEASSLPERRRRALALARRLLRLPVGTDHDGTLLTDVLAADIPRDSEDNWMVASLELIVARLGKLRQSASRSAFAERLTTTFRAMGLEGAELPVLSEITALSPASAEARLLCGLAREQAVGYRALLSTMGRVVSAAAALGQQEASISAGRFRAELEAALSGIPPEATHRAGGVRVVRVSEVAGLGGALLIVARASEGLFEPPVTSNTVLSEDVVGSLPRASRPAPHRRIAAAGRTAILAAIAASREVLVTRSITDGEGRAPPPAPLFGELMAGRSVAREHASSGASLSARSSELAALRRGASPSDPDVARRVAIENERLAFFLDPRMLPSETSGAIPLDEGDLGQHLRASFGGTSDRPIAATAVERAALCRFASFAARVLGASTDGGVGEGLEAGQRGSLIHRGLFLAFEAIRPERGTDDRAGAISRALAKALRELLRERASPLYRAEVLRALRDVRAVLEWSLEDESGFVFAYGERAFGEAKPDKRREGHEGRSRGAEAPSWPALAIGEGGSTLYVKGRIDRVDLSRDGTRARVIDYKTGAIPAWRDVGTLVFQPPLYAYAVMRQMGQLSLSEVRALYLDTGKRPPRVLPAAEKNQVLSAKQVDDAQRRAGQIVFRLWRGEVAPRPADALVCGRCDVRDVCRRPAAMPVEELELENEGGGS